MERINITDTKTWSSIDIFLFSNGQQYSPPRKYHLTSEELQWWEPTLNYLGRTQYGSGQSSIELYTIDGTKINGPLELINGAAYVAVKPPDSFINSGYEDYLLKATRSWEKRLAQKTNDTETTKLDNKNLKKEVDPDETYTEQNVMNDAVLSKITEDAEISSPTNFRSNKQGPQRKSITKQIQKMKTSDGHNTNFKKICTETDKIIPCPRKSSLKKSDDTNLRRLSLLCSTNPKRNMSKPQPTRSKRPNLEKHLTSQDKNNDIQPVRETYTTKHLTNLLLSCDEQVNLKNETNTNQNANVLSLSGEEQPIISLYKNKDIDLTSLKTDPDYDHMLDEELNDELKIDISTQRNPKNHQSSIKKPKDVVNYDNENEFQQINKIHAYDQKNSSRNGFNREEEETKCSNISILETHSKKKLSKEYITFSNQANITEKQVTDEYIAYLNKGTLLSLKFHIKVKDCKTICNRYKGDSDQPIPLLNMLKTEKTSQVNIDINFSGEVLNPNNEDCIENKSLQSLINKLCIENKSKTQSENPRFIIVQCGCDHLKEESLCKCFEREEKSKSTFNNNLNKTFSSCQCNDRSEGISKDENVRSTFMDLSPEKKDKKPSQINGTRVRSLAQKFEGSEKIDPYNSSNLLNNNNTSRNENKLPAIVTQLNDSSTIQRNNDVPITNENNNISLKYCCDKATQTDWCNVLLEARRQEDDTYTFHFPSLYILKQCKF